MKTSTYHHYKTTKFICNETYRRNLEQAFAKNCVFEIVLLRKQSTYIPHTYDPDFYPFRQTQALADVTKILCMGLA